MKTKIRSTGFLLLLLLGISFAVGAQPTPYTLTNNLHCSVVLFYELRSAGCGTPSSGPIIINAGASTVVNINPTNIIGGCLIIQQIGGQPAPGNHLWITMNPSFPPCHNVSSGQSGITTSCGPYAVTTTPNSWTIN
jgi:hypothetical protein